MKKTINRLLMLGSVLAVATTMSQCETGTPMQMDMPVMTVDMAAPPDTATPLPGPTLTSVTPALAGTAGGTKLTLSGMDFQMGATVTIAGQPATPITVSSPTSITATVPAKPGAWGKVAVAVTNNDLKMASRSDLFSYYASQIMFPGSTVAAGATPQSVASGDFNGDGLVDMVVANANGGNVSVFFGNGLGGFAAAVNYTAGTTPLAVGVGDFNGDMKLDIVTANQGMNNVSVLLNTGNGTFGTANTFGVGTQPRALVVSDLNGDGKPDVAVANQGSNNVSVLLGNGTGGFGAATNFTVGAQPVSLAAADVNAN